MKWNNSLYVPLDSRGLPQCNTQDRRHSSFLGSLVIIIVHVMGNRE